MRNTNNALGVHVGNSVVENKATTASLQELKCISIAGGIFAVTWMTNAKEMIMALLMQILMLVFLPIHLATNVIDILFWMFADSACRLLSRQFVECCCNQ